LSEILQLLLPNLLIPEMSHTTTLGNLHFHVLPKLHELPGFTNASNEYLVLEILKIINVSIGGDFQTDKMLKSTFNYPYNYRRPTI